MSLMPTKNFVGRSELPQNPADQRCGKSPFHPLP